MTKIEKHARSNRTCTSVCCHTAAIALPTEVQIESSDPANFSVLFIVPQLTCEKVRSILAQVGKFHQIIFFDFNEPYRIQH